MKTAIVTGAAQGVGFATASLLARSGFHAILTDVQSLEPQVRELQAAGLDVEGLNGDVSAEAFAQQLARHIEESCGAVDVLVNNAGVALIQAGELTTAAQWRRVMDVNLFGPFLLCRYLGRRDAKAQGWKHCQRGLGRSRPVSATAALITPPSTA